MDKVSFTAVLTDWNGKAIQSNIAACTACGRVAESEALTLRAVCLTALSASDERDVKASEKYTRFDLGMQIARRDEMELTPEEIVLLKSLINRIYSSPLIVAQAHRLLDPSLKSKGQDK